MQQSAIKDFLRSSNDRCRTQHNLSPGAANPVLRMQQAELSERRGRFLELIGGIGPELDKGVLLPDKGRYSLVISDVEGVIVEAFIPDGYQADFARQGIAPGGVWSEQVAGTNGVDMALRTDRVLTVQGDEHYYRCFHSYACSSAPLHDAQDNLLGSVTLVSGMQRRAAEIAWCEQVLRVAGSRLQAQLFRRWNEARITARLVSTSADHRRRFETIVACDEGGTVLSSLPLWRDGPIPAEHRQLEGRHLSELRHLSVTIHGPAMVLPRRPVANRDRLVVATPLRSRPGAALARMAGQGGGMDMVVERARKLAAHRVPLLVCGEPGVEKEAFVRALLEDVLPTAPALSCIDATSATASADLGAMLAQVRFLHEHPVDRVPPVLIVLNVDRLRGAALLALQDFLEDIERDAQAGGRMAQRPLLLMTLQGDWQAIQGDPAADRSLLFLTGQSVLSLPPLRVRNLGLVLDAVLETDFSGSLEIPDPVRARLGAHDWPGNLRELRAVLREAAICGNGRRINLVDLPARLAATVPAASAESVRQVLADALDSTGWNVTRTAARLGKSRATVNRWIAEHRLKRP